MRHIVRLSTTIVIAHLSMLASQLLAQSVESLDTLQRQMLSYRLQIQSGRIKIKSTVEIDKNPPIANCDKQEIEIDLWFRGGSIRSDRRHIAYIVGGHLVNNQRRIVANDELIYDEKDKKNVAVEITDAQSAGAPETAVNTQARDELFDPRICGLVNGPLFTWDNFGLEDAVSAAIPPGATVQKSSDGNQEDLTIKRQNFKDGKPITFTATISPSKGYAILNQKTSSALLEDTLVVEYKIVPGGVWFPSMTLYERSVDGQIQYRERTYVDADFSVPVDASLFTLASLELPSGRLVRSHGNRMVWNGTELVPEPSLRDQLRANLTTGGSAVRRFFLLANAVIVAAIAIFLTIKWFGRRARAVSET